MDNYMVNHIKKGTYDFLKKTVRNNTFSLNNSVRAIERTIHNSYEYLRTLQLAYVSIPKFLRYTDDDIVFEDDMYPHLYINKDFIDIDKRESYRLHPVTKNDLNTFRDMDEFGELSIAPMVRSFYNKYVTIDTIINNPKVFSWLPLVFRNGKIDTDVAFKFEGSGAVDIKFTSFNKLGTDPYLINTRNHRFDVIWLKNVTTVKASVTKNIFTNGYSTNTFKNTDAIFAFMTDGKTNTTLYPCSKSGSTISFIDAVPQSVINNLSNNFTIYFISPANMVLATGIKTFVNTDEGRKAIAVIEKNNDNFTFEEPIPKENILPFMMNSSTGTFLDFDANIVDHYPNIYEISRDEAIDGSYRLYYLYKELPDDFAYENKLRYVYIYLMNHTNSDSMESCIKKFLTSDALTKVTDEELVELFNDCWNYKDKLYTYSNYDFWNSNQNISKDFYNRNLDNDDEVYDLNELRDYDYLYKIGKMQSMVDDDFTILQRYGMETNVPFKSYFFNIRAAGFNFEERARYDSYTIDFAGVDDVPEEKKITFTGKHYLFKFRNEDSSKVYLNIFIDGKQVPKTDFRLDYGFKVVEHPLQDYIYIPATYFEPGVSTVVEIEKLDNYKFTHKQYFEDSNLIDITFNKKDLINPTLFDLFIVDEDNVRLSWTYPDSNQLRFDVYVKIPDDSQYAVTDHNFNDTDVIRDSNTGEYYIIVNDLLYRFEEAYKSNNIQESLDLLPLKYVILDKIKIRCKDSSLYNTKLKILINKNPYTFTKRMNKDGIPKIKLYEGKLLWRGMVSYIRTFVDGYYMPVNYMLEEVSPTEVYLLPRLKVKEGEVIDFEISPYSYEMEFYLKNIPDNKVIDFGDKLSRPFSFYYYDVYLNGIKVNAANVVVLTPTKIYIDTIDDKYNLAVYRRDKDYEYYISTNKYTPTDKVAEDKEIIKKKKEDPTPNPPGPKPGPYPPPPPPPPGEDRWIKIMSEHDYQYYMFYLNKIIPRGVTKGNDWNISKEELNDKYPIVYNNFSNKINRIVMRPNVDYKLRDVLMIGHKTDLDVADINYIVEDE